MSKVAVGSIPEKICYVSSKTQETPVGCEWDIDYWDKTKTKMETVLPAFPADNGDEKMLGTATHWAEGYGYNQPKNPVTKDIQDNKPIKDVRVLKLEHRGQGGRAYKVVANNYFVDLREDVLMDAMLVSGIAPGGILQGEFIWAKMGSQMKLVRIGSEVHRLIVEYDSKKDIKPVGKLALEVGGIYQTRKKEKAIFLGYVNTIIFKSKDKRPSWEKGKNYKASFDYEQKPIKKAMMFYSLYSHEAIEVGTKDFKSSHRYTIKKSHTYIEKVGNTDSTNAVPDNAIELLRASYVKDMKERLVELTGKAPPRQPYAQINDAWMEESIAYHSEHLNLYKFGEEPVALFDAKKLLLFS